MGACNFIEFGAGRTAQQAFDSLCADAEWEYGHSPYNGTISTTRLAKGIRKVADEWSEEARDMWLAAVDEVMETGRKAGAMERSFGQAVRWIARRRAIGDRDTLGYDPAVRILHALREVVKAGRTMPPPLRRDWETFG